MLRAIAASLARPNFSVNKLRTRRGCLQYYHIIILKYHNSNLWWYC